jgi:plastocyanin
MLMCLLLLAVGCEGDASLNEVQGSAKVDASWFVSKSAEAGFVSDCKVVSVGDTVQWTNADVGIPADVTSPEEPLELYSPNLQGPYTSWSHTFNKVGQFPYYDTQSGDPGRAVVDAYYGTVTWVGASDDAHRGQVCVRPGGGSGEGSCCCSDLDCDLELGLQCGADHLCNSS